MFFEESKQAVPGWTARRGPGGRVLFGFKRYSPRDVPIGILAVARVRDQAAAGYGTLPFEYVKKYALEAFA